MRKLVLSKTGIAVSVLFLSLLFTAFVPVFMGNADADNIISTTPQTSETQSDTLTDTQEQPAAQKPTETGTAQKEIEEVSIVPDNEATLEKQPPSESPANEPDTVPPSVPDVPDMNNDNGGSAFYCSFLEAVTDHPGWYQSIREENGFDLNKNGCILFFGQTGGLENYIGKPVTILGTVKGENLGVDMLYKHLPVEVSGFRDAADGEDFCFSSEAVTLTGMMELREPRNLVLQSSERGDVLIQTEISDFDEDNYKYPASFSGALYPISGHDCQYLLIAYGYSIMDYPEG